MTFPNTSAIDEYQNPAEQAMTVEDYALAKQLAEQAQVDAQLISTTARSVTKGLQCFAGRQPRATPRT